MTTTTAQPNSTAPRAAPTPRTTTRPGPAATTTAPAPEAEAGTLQPAITPQRLLLAAGLAAVAVAVGWGAWTDIATIAYRVEEASHIFLVPIIVVWLVWARLGSLLAAPLTHRWVGVVMVAVGAAMEGFGYTQQVDAAWHLGAVVMFAGAVVTALGGTVLWRAWPAFVVLGFLVPVPGMIRLEIALPLQEASAQATEFLMQAVGYDVERSVNLLIFNGEQIGIAEACNGMRMFFALLLVSYAFAFAMPLKPWVRALIIVFSPAAAIACNIIRLGPTVWVYGMYPDSTAAELAHTLGGWAMLGVAFLLLLGLVRLLEWAQIPVMQDRSSVDSQVDEGGGGA